MLSYDFMYNLGIVLEIACTAVWFVICVCEYVMGVSGLHVQWVCVQMFVCVWVIAIECE